MLMITWILNSPIHHSYPYPDWNVQSKIVRKRRIQFASTVVTGSFHRGAAFASMSASNMYVDEPSIFKGRRE
jgi:hypothetical protein